jgi:NitT/TauT family transport system substrate-binding protein
MLSTVETIRREGCLTRVRSSMRKTVALLALIAVVVVQLPGVPGQAQAVRTLKVRMDWRYQGYHAPFFVALEKGYYKAAGLDVELLSGQGSGIGVKTVSSGAEELGFLDASVVALSIAKGAPLKVVAGIVQQNPAAVISWKDKAVTSPKDMEGRTIAWVPGVATNFLVTALWRANSIDEAKIRKVSTTREAADTLFLERKVEMGTGFVNATWAGYLAEGHGKDMQIMRVADWGVNALSLAIVAHTKLIAEQPEVVRSFVAATLRALREVRDSPEAGWKSVVRQKPEVEAKLAQIGLENTLPLLATANTKGKPLGWMSDKDWDATLDFLATYMGLGAKQSLDTYYTNAFVPSS